MPGLAIRRIASPALFACAVLAVAAVAASAAAAQSPTPGVFSEVQSAVAPQVSPALEPATMRSRLVQLNTQKITAARRGREFLTLNLFDDAVVEVDIRRIRPTRAGYFFFGHPRGADRGEVQLVVNGRVMVGTVRTPDGTFTIRPSRSGHHLVRQIDPSRDPFECEVEDGPLHDPAELPAISSIGPAPSLATAPSVASDVPTEDGSEIRILIAYTTAVEQAHGGAAGMNALIDLMMQSANQAFENSGITPRLVLAHTVRVHYGETGSLAPTQDLHRLRTPDDGYMDEVHALRNEHAADLVHLVGTGAASGRAYALRNERLSSERYAFGITWAPAGSPAEYVFTHEVGHNLGLLHDRYVEKAKRSLYPYAYGYVNKEAFEAGAAESSRWRTVMSYPNRCADEGFSPACEWLLRFSNPDQTYLGDALGITGEEHVVDPDGPSDARRTINSTAALAASYRSEACTDFTAAPTNHVVSADGGRLVVEVDTAHGCLWAAANAPDYVEVVSQTPIAGSGSIVIAVAANQSGEDRVGTITVAGNAITVNQLGTTDGVCGRTSGVFQAITNVAGIADAARCSEVTDSALARIGTLDLRDKSLVSLKPEDLAGLTGLRTLYLNRNEITELPEEIFAGLTSLESLNLSDNELTGLPENVFEGLSGLQSLQLGGNPLGEIPAGLFAGVAGLRTLNLDNNRFASLPDGLFGGLSNLQELRLARNRLSTLPATLFAGLSGLRSLYLSGNRLRNLPVGTFSGLSALESLTLSYNEIDSLPVGLFDGLSGLKQLHLHSNRLTRLPTGYFEKLVSLQSLSLGQNQFGNLPGELFRGLSSLQVLSLDFNGFSQLPTGLFSGLSSLEDLRLNNNRFSDLPIELFDGLSRLRLLDLRSNRFTRLPDHLFSSLPALTQLFLSGNASDPLPLQVTLEKVGEDQFKVVVPTGAPFELAVPVSTRGGAIEGAASSVTIAATEEESSPLRVTRQEGSPDAVTADIGTLPGLPSGHLGYVLEKGASLPLEILKPQGSRDVALAGLSLGRWALDPAFAPDTLQYAAVVGNEVSSITVTATVRSADAAVQLLDVNDNSLADADAAAEGHQASLSPGPNTIKAKVTAADGTTARTYTLVVTRDGPGGVCARTPQIRDGIVRAVRNVDACAEVTGEHLTAITNLWTRNQGIDSLRTGDFAGLSAVRSLLLDGNRLTTLPADVFAGMTALEDLWLQGNRIEALPAGIFAGLPALERILLDDNRLDSLPQEIFSDLPALKSLSLQYNRLPGIPTGLFSGLTSIERIDIDANEIRSVSREMFTGLTSLKHLSMQSNPIGSLPADLFSSMTSLEILSLYGLTLTELPEGIFSGLRSIKSLGIGGIQLSRVPAGLFSGLTTLESLRMHRMGLNSLPDGVFSGLTGLESLWLADNNLSSLQHDIFSGLTSLDRLGLAGNNLAGLPANLFSGLTALEDILLSENQLRSLPAGLFLGLASIAELELQGNAVFPLPVSITLERAGTSEFKAVAPTAAPFALEIEIDVSASGEIAGGGNTVTIPAGSVESAPVAVNRVPGTADSVTVDIRRLPNPPGDHRGYALEKEGALPLELAPRVEPGTDATLSALVLSAGVLNPSFGPGVTGYTATVGNAVSSITVTPTKSDANATLAYRNANDAELDDADDIAPGRQAVLSVGENTIKVHVTAADGTTTRTYTIVVTRQDATNVCGRTAQVRDAIVAAIPGVDNCRDATGEQVSGITVLEISGESIASLQSGDFDGLTGLRRLDLSGNGLTGLPDGVFSDLTSLITLRLNANQLSSLPAGIFSGLAALEDVRLFSNQLNSLPADLFSGLSALEAVSLTNNQLASLPPGVFSGLSGLRFLWLSNNRLSDLPAGAFSDLAALQVLQLDGNQLSSLPDGLFSGLAALATVRLERNPTDPLPLSVTLQKVGQDQFEASASTGAPFALELPVEVSGGGIASGAGAVTIAVGDVTSGSLAVERTGGSREAVTVDFGALPDLPANHSGYVLEKDPALPTEILPAVIPSGDAKLSDLSLSAGLLDPVFDADTTRYAVSVANGVAWVTVNPTTGNQAASVAYLDESDQPLTDANAGVGGHQVNLDAGENVVRVQVTAEDGTTTETYTLAITRQAATDVCERTKAVQDAIVAAVAGIDKCGDLTGTHLAAITGLDISGENVASLQSGDFDQLSALELLKLSGNALSGLPSDIFAGLSALQTLELQDNRLDNLPAGLFSSLARLESLSLAGNRLTALPAGLFSALADLQSLQLQNNRLSGLPNGIFVGLNSLAELDLSGNAANPVPLTVNLEKVGADLFRAAAPAGAPYTMVVSLGIGGSGTIAGGASTLTIPRGAAASAPLGVSRVSGAKAAVAVDIAALPGLPSDHRGYAPQKNSSLPREILPVVISDDASLSNLALDHGALDPAFAAGTTRYAATVANEVSVVTVTATTRDADATVEFLDAADQALTDADANAQGHQASLNVGENTIKAKVTAENGSATRVYTVVITRESSAVDTDCDRTREVCDAIVAALADIDDYSDVTAADLARITLLDLSDDGISSLQSGDFAGLTALEELDLSDNNLIELPGDIFSGLSALLTLDLTANQLTSLPPGVFSGLTTLQTVKLALNRLGSVPSNVFSGLTALESVNLATNRLNEVPGDLFSGLSALESITLGSNRLTSLPSKLFSGLSALSSLELSHNRLSALPDGLFSGLSGLEQVNLSNNTVNPLPLAVSLKEDGTDQVRAVAAAGATFAMSIPLSVSSAGEFADGGGSVSIAVGAVESAAVQVERTAGTTAAVTVDIGTLPALPSTNHFGYVLEKDTALPLEIIPTVDSTQDASLSGLALSAGTLDPAFAPATTRYTATVGNAVASLTVTPAKNVAGATVSYLDANDNTLTDANANTDGHQVSLSVGDNTFKVKVTAQDASTERVYTVVVTRESATGATAGICGRTEAVRTAILAALAAIDACADVTDTHLSGLTALNLSGKSIASLKSGDFAGLTAMTELNLRNNDLGSLPADVFSGLAALRELELGANELSSLPSDVFSGLTALQTLSLGANLLSSLPSDVFSGLTALEVLYLSTNRLATLPAGIFSGLSALEHAGLNGNRLNALPAGVFSGLTALRSIQLHGNELTTLPSNIFSGLPALALIGLGENRFRTLPAGLFSGLDALESLNLADNGMTSLSAGVFTGLTALDSLSVADNKLKDLPSGVFSGLTALRILRLHDNELSALPDGVFSGLGALATLSLQGNTADPMPIPVDLEKVGTNEVRAVAAKGAPFALGLPLIVSASGGIENGVASLTVAVGAVESPAVGVTRLAGNGNAVTVDIGTLPPLPTGHSGYVLEKASDLPRLILAKTSISSDASLSNLQLSDGALRPGFGSATTRYAATVLNSVASITVTPSKQDADASVAFLDAGDNPLADADTGADGHQVSLGVGDTTFKIKVTAEDTTTTRTYTVVVTRNAGAAAADVTLGSLAVVGQTLNPAFAPSTTGYTVSVGSSVSRVTIAATALNANARVNYTGANTFTLPDADSKTDGFQTNLQYGQNTVRVHVVAENRSTQRFYPIVITRGTAAEAGRGICSRTEQIRNRILDAVSGVNACGDVTAAHLAGVTRLDLSRQFIESLRSGDFAGLTGLQTLYLNGNRFRALPGGLFAGLSSLRTLWLYDNVYSLPDGIFTGLASLQELKLLKSPPRVPLTIPVRLEKVADGQFRAVAPRGATFTMQLPVTVSSAGEIDSNTATISVGTEESAVIDVTRAAGMNADITVDIGTLPGPPASHEGYNLAKDASLPLTVLGELALPNDAALLDLSLSPGALAPAFAPATTEYTASVSNDVSAVTVSPTRYLTSATLAYLDANDAALDDADNGTDGHQVNLGVGANTIKVKVSTADGMTTQTYTIVVTRGASQSHTPVIGTTSPISVAENQTVIATLEATDGDGDEIVWSTNGGADEALFNLTEAGVLSFVSAPDYENPTDDDGNNDYVVVVSASDQASGSSELTLTVNVTDVDETPPARDDATLGSLSLSSGTLDPAFAGATTRYAAAVANAVSTITVSYATTNSNADVDFLDGDDNALTDANDVTEGHQVDLSAGENTIKLKVTAEDTTTTETYTLVVTRNNLPGIQTYSPLFVGENQTFVATLAATDADGDNITWSKTGGADRDLFNLTSAGVLTFASAPDYEMPGDADTGNDYVVTVSASDGTDSATLVLTVNVSDLVESSARDDASLSSLSMNGRTVPNFSPGESRFVALVSSAVSRVTVTHATSNPNAAVAHFDGTDSSLADADAGTDGHQVDVSVGQNPIKVKVTAEDGVTTRTYLLIVNRSANLPTAAEVEITTASPIHVEENQTAVATLEHTHRDGHAVHWFLSTFLGAVDGNLFDLTSAGVLTFKTAPDFEEPGDQDENNEYELDVIASNGLLIRSAQITVIVTNVTEAGETSSDATLSGLALSEGTLSPAFESGATSYTASVGSSVSSITVTPTTSDANAVPAFLDARGDELADADTTANHHQVNLSVGRNTITVRVTAEDTTTTQAYEIVITRGTATGVCARTEQVRDAIVAAVSGVDACEDVTATQLAGITQLDLEANQVSSLQAGDFAGLSGLSTLQLASNQLTSLPSGVFSGLTSLTSLFLGKNQLSALPSGAFNDLGSLSTLYLGDNQLSAVPADVISGLSTLEILGLANNRIGALASDDFSGLSSLEKLFLGGNRLGNLPDGVFSGLGALQELWLAGNSTDPLPLTVSLEKVGESQLKAVAPVGAPFAIAVPVSVSGAGEIEGGAESVTVSTGGTESAAVTVTRVSGTTAAVTADIGTLPGLPERHAGYVLQKDSGLPLTVLAAQSGAPGAGAAQGALYADVNDNGRIEADDAMLLYHAFASVEQLGDGETGGTPRRRQTLLAGLSDTSDPDDDELRGMLRRANQWRELGVEAGGDINGDGAIDGNDAMIMYNAYAFEDLLGGGESGGAARFRRSLLAEHAARPNPTDADLKALLRTARALRAEALAP